MAGVVTPPGLCRVELRRMIEMFAAAGKIQSTDWTKLPSPPV